MKKPELLVTPTSVDDIFPLIEAGADAFVVGEQRYGLRLAGEMTREDVKESIHRAHFRGKKIYVAMNAIFHNEKVDELYDYVKFVHEAGGDGIIFGDPAVLMIAREIAPDMKLHWSTETTGTNWYHCNFWGKKGAKRAVLAKEINLDEVLEIKEHAEVEIEVQIHGMTAMFQSKRTLLGNYFEFLGKPMKIENRRQNKNMFLYDKERDNKYPIFEDENGTHIMSPRDVCMIDELEDFIDGEIDSLKIDGILKSSSYIQRVTALYRRAIDLCAENREKYEEEKADLYKEIEKIQPPNRPLDTGFYFKETVY